MKRLRLVSLAAACAALVPVSGCGQLASLAGGGPGNGGHLPPNEGGIYTGAECAKYQSEDPRSEGVFRTYHDVTRAPIFKGERRTGLTPAESAVFVVCVDATGPSDVNWSDALVADHLDFDDRHFDHLRAGAMVIDCALNPECSALLARDILGMMAGYARRVEPGPADAALAAAGASPGLREAFTAKLAWARGTIEQRVTELDPRRKEIWVDIPEQVWAERQEYFARYAKLYAALDPVLAGTERGDGDLAGAARELRSLRGRYLESCKVEGCLFTPFVLETTRALTLIAVRQKDVPTALAEADLLADDRLASQYFSRAMVAALIPATTKEAERYQKYRSAEQSGADPAALQAMFGNVAPINISPDGPWTVWGRKQIPNLTSALSHEGLENAGGDVRAVKRKGGDAIVQFADVVSSWEEDNCHETNKIDGIDSSGHIIYRQSCRPGKVHTERRKIDPIEVPYEDAARLRPGDVVNAWVMTDGRHGAITYAMRENQLVQVRGHRLKVKESHRER